MVEKFVTRSKICCIYIDIYYFSAYLCLTFLTANLQSAFGENSYANIFLETTKLREFYKMPKSVRRRSYMHSSCLYLKVFSEKIKQKIVIKSTYIIIMLEIYFRFS